MTATELKHAAHLRQLIAGDARMMAALRAARAVDPPDWFISGGIIRNLVWDALHGYAKPTPLDDVDLVYYDAGTLDTVQETAVEEALAAIYGTVRWEATNQARVDLWTGRDRVPTRTADAIAHWPETAVAVGVRLLADDTLMIVAPLGLDDLFGMICRRNPAGVSVEKYRRRVVEKRIRGKWPRVTVVDG